MSPDRRENPRGQSRRDRETRRLHGERVQPPRPRGHQRWLTRTRLSIVLAAALIAAGIGGGYYYYDQNTPYSISASEGIPQVQSALDVEGVSFDSQEKDLWEKAEQEKQGLPTDTLQLTVDTRLNLLRKTMLASKNPFFSSTAQYLDNLIQQRVLATRILTDAKRSTTAETSADIINGKLFLSLNIPVTTIRDDPLLYSALYLVHERKHMEDYQAVDAKNQNLSDAQRINALKGLRGTREKDLKFEAPAYAEQARAFLRASALGGLNTDDTRQLPLAAHLLRVDNNPMNPKFLAYLVKMGYVD